MEEAGAETSYLDPHVPQIPAMREYSLYKDRTSLTPEDLTPGYFSAVLIATDHDAIDYAALLALGCPIVDTRNAIARRGLPMQGVTKA